MVTEGVSLMLRLALCCHVLDNRRLSLSYEDQIFVDVIWVFSLTLWEAQLIGAQNPHSPPSQGIERNGLNFRSQVIVKRMSHKIVIKKLT